MTQIFSTAYGWTLDAEALEGKPGGFDRGQIADLGRTNAIKEHCRISVAQAPDGKCAQFDVWLEWPDVHEGKPCTRGVILGLHSGDERPIEGDTYSAIYETIMESVPAGVDPTYLKEYGRPMMRLGLVADIEKFRTEFEEGYPS